MGTNELEGGGNAGHGRLSPQALSDTHADFA